MKSVLMIVALSPLLVACEGGWPSEYRKDYMEVCIEDARQSSFPDSAQAVAYCQCSMESLMKHYATIDAMLVNKDSLAIREELQACRDQVTAR